MTMLPAIITIQLDHLLMHVTLSYTVSPAIPSTKSPKYERFSCVGIAASTMCCLSNHLAHNGCLHDVQVPRGAGSPPVPIMHSPPRPVSVKDQQDWKIPPSISNWKNPKGYTIPLDKRLAADGRGLQETAINDSFAKFTEALYMAESSARQASECRHPCACPIACKLWYLV